MTRGDIIQVSYTGDAQPRNGDVYEIKMVYDKVITLELVHRPQAAEQVPPSDSNQGQADLGISVSEVVNTAESIG